MRCTCARWLGLVAVLLAGWLPATPAEAAIDCIKNFALVSVSTGYDAAATSVTLSTGEGARLCATTPYNLTWWNSTDYPNASLDPSREIVRVTARTGDVLTVTRGQEGTTATAKNLSGKTYRMSQGFTELLRSQIETDIAAQGGGITNVTDAAGYATLQDAITAVCTGSKTLRVSTSMTLSGNASLPTDCLLWVIGGGLVTASNASLTMARPEQCLCDRHRQVFALSGTGSVAFANPGTVYPAWFGAKADGMTDDGPEIQAAHDSLPSGGGTLDFVGGLYKSNQEVAISKSNVVVRLGPATLDVTNIAGTGTTGVHDADTVIAGLKVTGSNVKVLGGTITGLDTVSSKRVVGVLVAGGDQFKMAGTYVEDLWAPVWIGGNAVAPVLQHTLFLTNVHGVLLGYWPTTSSSPQVSDAVLINVRSQSATTGSGLRLYSYSYRTVVLGGSYSSNAAHGISLYPGGQDTTIQDATISSNTLDGVYATYDSLTGTAANKLGLASGGKLLGSRLDANGRHNVSVHLPDYSTFSGVGGVEDWQIRGNTSTAAGGRCFYLGLVRSVVADNSARGCTAHGVELLSTQDVTLRGNQSWDHGTTGANQRAYVFSTSPTTGSTPPDNVRVLMSDNHGGDTRSGGARTINFAADLSKIANSQLTGNAMTNANTTDWFNVTGHTGLYLAQNTGTGDIGQAYQRHLMATATWDPAALASNAEASVTLTVTGAAAGDRVLCGHTQVTGDLLQLTALVSATNTVRAVLENLSGSTVDVSSGTLTCEVWQ